MSLIALARSCIALAALCVASACSSSTTPLGDAARPTKATPVPSASAVSPVPLDAPALCARDGADAVRDIFCKVGAPAIHGIAELRDALELTTAAPADAGSYVSVPAGYDSAGGALVVLLSHSTSLSGNLVSPINPRAIVMNGYSLLAFNRGVQQVEVISTDRDTSKFNFYLVRFEQACNTTEKGCSPGDLFTPKIESDWIHVSVADAEDLKDTPSDCLQCHQRATKTPLLLMRELDGPWTHYFGPDSDHQSDFPEATGSDLTRDYSAAKGDEAYAGIPWAVLRATIGFTLENVVTFSQPIVFDGSTIMNERWPWSPEGYPATAVRSKTWDAAFAAFKRGEQLALPFYAPRATDPVKQAAMTAAYRSYLSGDAAADDLPTSPTRSPTTPGRARRSASRRSPARHPPRRSWRRAAPATTTCSIRRSRALASISTSRA